MDQMCVTRYELATRAETALTTLGKESCCAALLGSLANGFVLSYSRLRFLIQEQGNMSEEDVVRTIQSIMQPYPAMIMFVHRMTQQEVESLSNVRLMSPLDILSNSSCSPSP